MCLYFMPLDTNINPDLCINDSIFCKVIRLSILMQENRKVMFSLKLQFEKLHIWLIFMYFYTYFDMYHDQKYTTT